MQFTKKQGTMLWWTSFNQLTYINSILEVKDSSVFYGCGDYDVLDAAGAAVTTTNYTAGIFKMDNDGSVKWMMVIGGNNPSSAASNQDRCFGLTINNANTGTMTALLQVKAKEIRSYNYNPGDYYDTVLMQFDSSGRVLRAVQITNGNVGYSMFSSSQGLVYAANNHFFAGWSYGFQTNLQTLKKDFGAQDYDSYVYMYMFDHDQSYSCIFENTITSSTMSGVITTLV